MIGGLAAHSAGSRRCSDERLWAGWRVDWISRRSTQPTSQSRHCSWRWHCAHAETTKIQQTQHRSVSSRRQTTVFLLAVHGIWLYTFTTNGESVSVPVFT